MLSTAEYELLKIYISDNHQMTIDNLIFASRYFKDSNYEHIINKLYKKISRMTIDEYEEIVKKIFEKT